MDFKQVYDSVNRTLIFDIVEQLWISSNIRELRFYIIMFNHVLNEREMHHAAFEWFSVNTCLRQGCIIGVRPIIQQPDSPTVQ